MIIKNISVIYTNHVYVLFLGLLILLWVQFLKVYVILRNSDNSTTPKAHDFPNSQDSSGSDDSWNWYKIIKILIGIVLIVVGLTALVWIYNDYCHTVAVFSLAQAWDSLLETNFVYLNYSSFLEFKDALESAALLMNELGDQPLPDILPINLKQEHIIAAQALVELYSQLGKQGLGLLTPEQCLQLLWAYDMVNHSFGKAVYIINLFRPI